MILNVDNIRQEKSNEGQILIVHKKFYRQSLNKKFRTHVKKPMAFKNFKE